MKYLKGMFPNVKEIFGQLEQILGNRIRISVRTLLTEIW